MTLEDFTKIIELVKEHCRRQSVAGVAGLDTMEFCEPMDELFTHFLELLFGEENEDVISAFCFEHEFGKDLDGKHPFIWSKDNEPLVWDVPTLYEFITPSGRG